MVCFHVNKSLPLLVSWPKVNPLQCYPPKISSSLHLCLFKFVHFPWGLFHWDSPPKYCVNMWSLPCVLHVLSMSSRFCQPNSSDGYNWWCSIIQSFLWPLVFSVDINRLYVVRSLDCGIHHHHNAITTVLSYTLPKEAKNRQQQTQQRNKKEKESAWFLAGVTWTKRTTMSCQ
jgi:hypothetical protein